MRIFPRHRPASWAAACVALCCWLRSSRSTLEPVARSAFVTPSHRTSAETLRIGGLRDERLVALSAYRAIQRRDSITNTNLQKWVGQQLKLEKRQSAGASGTGVSVSDEKRNAYLAKLGLANKIAPKVEEGAWHLNHIAPGDVLEGWFEHPSSGRVDLTYTAETETRGVMTSTRGTFESEATLEQDFPIAYEEGEQQDQDMTAYVFMKFNELWRNFDAPMPDESVYDRLSFKGIQTFVNQVTEVPNYPTDDDYQKACAEPDQGMTKSEFLTFLRAEDQQWLSSSFKGVFTGRRLRIKSSLFDMEGDFMNDLPMIFGFGVLEGKPGGSWKLELKRR
ncbi:unnamed protein product [Polarella glacialis]|uniref:Uncharacterized protein n=2 Tax=Polarella glacialis TaxID=89957 RepID=A0A813EAB9_POLGL|nr:unnamed protein product [Polarella glacialis]